MIKFIKKTSIFLFPILILTIIFEILLRNIPNDYIFKKNKLDEHSKKISVLYLGNSHIYFGINPKFSNFNGFNASHISQSLNYDYEILKKYEDKLINLKFIIIPIDYLTLFASLENDTESWRTKNYTIYYNMSNKFEFTNNFECLTGKFKTNFERLTNFYVQNNSIITCNEYGWGTTYKSCNNKNLNKSGKIAARRHTYNLKKNKSFISNWNYLTEIIKFSKDKKIKIIFITCPAFKTYTENLNLNQLNFTLNKIKEMLPKNKNCFYYNLLTNKNFKKTDFYDADHLNEIGAKKFTKMIDSLIINTNKNEKRKQF